MNQHEQPLSPVVKSSDHPKSDGTYILTGVERLLEQGRGQRNSIFGTNVNACEVLKHLD